MNKKSLIIISLLFLFGCSSNKKAFDDIDSFIGKPIATFLSNYNQYDSIYVVCRKPFVASSLRVIYDSCDIELFPTRFTHMEPSDSSMQWDKELFKLEIIRAIRVLQDDYAIDACPKSFLASPD